MPYVAEEVARRKSDVFRARAELARLDSKHPLLSIVDGHGKPGPSFYHIYFEAANRQELQQRIDRGYVPENTLGLTRLPLASIAEWDALLRYGRDVQTAIDNENRRRSGMFK